MQWRAQTPTQAHLELLLRDVELAHDVLLLLRRGVRDAAVRAQRCGSTALGHERRPVRPSRQRAAAACVRTKGAVVRRRRAGRRGRRRRVELLVKLVEHALQLLGRRRDPAAEGAAAGRRRRPGRGVHARDGAGQERRRRVPLRRRQRRRRDGERRGPGLALLGRVGDPQQLALRVAQIVQPALRRAASRCEGSISWRAAGGSIKSKGCARSAAALTTPAGPGPCRRPSAARRCRRQRPGRTRRRLRAGGRGGGTTTLSRGSSQRVAN
jgi:hypothetical protein